jgi:hypothetical protein
MGKKGRKIFPGHPFWCKITVILQTGALGELLVYHVQSSTSFLILETTIERSSHTRVFSEKSEVKTTIELTKSKFKTSFNGHITYLK